MYLNGAVQRAAVGIVACLIVSSVLTAKDQKSSAVGGEQKAYQRSTDAALYVGSEECKTCHEEQSKVFRTRELQTLKPWLESELGRFHR